MGLRIDKRDRKAPPPKPVTITSHKDFKSLILRNTLVNQIKRLNRLLSIQQKEIYTRYREVAARYQEVVELRWAFLKAQCLEQARQMFGTQLSHLVYDTVIWGTYGIKDGVGIREEDAAFVVSIHCVNRQARSSSSSSSNGTPARTTLPPPPREQREDELELLDGCFAAALQRPQWMPRHLVLEICDWQSGGGGSGDCHGHGSATPRRMPSPYVSQRRAEFCQGSFDACAAMREEAQARSAEVAKVSADTALVVCDDDSGEESHREAVAP
ncbi:hypothetical protein PG994_014201 [Apiospora phragmitis]|uniref:Uncharacterized protein n=1 Tax=Apiospora phragmitis TaxID=2905665 RepID=A0ABR1T5N9_9PEZI